MLTRHLQQPWHHAGSRAAAHRCPGRAGGEASLAAGSEDLALRAGELLWRRRRSEKGRLVGGGWGELFPLAASGTGAALTSSACVLLLPPCGGRRQLSPRRASPPEADGHAGRLRYHVVPHAARDVEHLRRAHASGARVRRRPAAPADATAGKRAEWWPSSAPARASPADTVSSQNGSLANPGCLLGASGSRTSTRDVFRSVGGCANGSSARSCALAYSRTRFVPSTCARVERGRVQKARGSRPGVCTYPGEAARLAEEVLVRVTVQGGLGPSGAEPRAALRRPARFRRQLRRRRARRGERRGA